MTLSHKKIKLKNNKLIEGISDIDPPPSFNKLLVFDMKSNFLGYLNEDELIKKYGLEKIEEFYQNLGNVRIETLDFLYYDDFFSIYKIEEINCICRKCNDKKFVFGVELDTDSNQKNNITSKKIYCLHEFLKLIDNSGNKYNYLLKC